MNVKQWAPLMMPFRELEHCLWRRPPLDLVWGEFIGDWRRENIITFKGPSWQSLEQTVSDGGCRMVDEHMKKCSNFILRKCILNYFLLAKLTNIWKEKERMSSYGSDVNETLLESKYVFRS